MHKNQLKNCTKKTGHFPVFCKSFIFEDFYRITVPVFPFSASFTLSNAVI